MAWFNRRNSVPNTSYGYAPPDDAVVSGWICSSPRCGYGGSYAPSRWPQSCPFCGSSADPEFAEPWAHDALRSRLLFELEVVTRNPDHDNYRPAWALNSELLLWAYEDARRNGRPTVDARRAWADHMRTMPTGLSWTRLIWAELECGDVDAAVEDVFTWLGESDWRGQETDPSWQPDLPQMRGLMDCLLKTEQAARTAGLPVSAELRREVLDLAELGYDELSNDDMKSVIECVIGPFGEGTPPSWGSSFPGFRSPADLLTPADVARFGRMKILGEGECLIGNDVGADIDLGYGGGEGLMLVNYSDRPITTDELARHSAEGSWEAVGAWQLVLAMPMDDYLFPNSNPTLNMIRDRGILALHEITGGIPRSNLNFYESERYVELTGEFGEEAGERSKFPPDSVSPDNFLATRDHHKDHVLRAAAARRPRRATSRPGSTPAIAAGGAEDLSIFYWQALGHLITCGPLCGALSEAYEPHFVSRALASAEVTDHGQFADALSKMATKDRSDAERPAFWTGMACLGMARFIEDYLSEEQTGSAAHTNLVDIGLTVLNEAGWLGTSVFDEGLSDFEKQRLAELRSH